MPYRYINAKNVRQSCKALGKRCTTSFLDELEDKTEDVIKLAVKVDGTDGSVRGKHIIGIYNMLKGLEKL